MIEHVTLEDWKSHKQTELDFSGGINALVGEMGSGKSSVLEAITFALFGTLPSLQGINGYVLDDLIRRSPTKAETAAVMVRFSFGDSTYQVSRQVKRDAGTTEAKLHKDDELIAGPQATEVTAAVEEILGIDYDLFASIIFAEQNQLDSFLSLTPGQRKETIDQLLKLDRFEDARGNLVTLRNRVRDRYNDRKDDRDELQEQIDEDEIDELRETLTDLTDRLDELTENLDEKKERLETVNEQLQEMEEQEEQHEELEKRRTKLQAAIDNLNEQIKDHNPDASDREEAEQRKEELQDEREQLEETEEQLQEIATDITVASNNRERLEDKLDELREQEEQLERLDDVENKLDEQKETAQELQEDLSDASAELEQVEESLASLSTAAETCPTCGQELTDDHRLEILQENKKRKQELEGRIEEIEEELEQRRETIDDLEEERDQLLRYSDIEDKIDEKEEKLDAIEDKLDDLNEKKEQLEEAYTEEREEEIEERIEELEDDLDYFTTVETINEKQEELATVEKKLDDISFDDEQLEKLKDERNDLKSDIKVLTNEQETKEELVKEKEKRLEELEEQQERLEELERTVEKYSLLRDALTDLETDLEETQSEMRRQFVARANDRMQTVWDRVYPYDDYSSIRLRAGDDYVLEIKDDRGDWFSVEGEVSGGERHTAALSLRIALALVLAPGLKLLILDEPTHNLDDRAIDDMAEMLRANVSDLVDQLFLITHDEQLEAAVTGSLYHLRKKDTDHGLTEVDDASFEG